MAQTTWSGPLASGDRNAGESGGPNLGLVTLSQTVLINFNATLVQNATFNIPASSQIVDFYVDVLTAYDSATSATLSAGTASGGTQYLSGVSVKTAARRSNGFSAAQLAALSHHEAAAVAARAKGNDLASDPKGDCDGPHSVIEPDPWDMLASCRDYVSDAQVGMIIRDRNEVTEFLARIDAALAAQKEDQ